MIVTIDPGLKGGICLYDQISNEIKLYHMPTVPYGTKSTIDVKSISKLLDGANKIYIETQHTFPRQGGVSNFTNGFNFGKLLSAIELSNIPYTLISSRKWKNNMGIFKGLNKRQQKKKAIDGLKEDIAKGIDVQIFALKGGKRKETKRINDGVADAYMMFKSLKTKEIRNG